MSALLGGNELGRLGVEVVEGDVACGAVGVVCGLWAREDRGKIIQDGRERRRRGVGTRAHRDGSRACARAR